MALFVLIHGAWQGSWCWREVTPRLEKLGHRVIAPDLPGHADDSKSPQDITLKDYTDAIITIVEPLAERPVLVGPSMTGIVAQVAEYIPKRLSGLVYVAGTVVADGHTMLDRVNGLDPEYLQQIVWAPDGKTAQLTPEGAQRFLYSSCPGALVQEVLPWLTPEPVAPFQTPLRITSEHFGRIPKYYIECLLDRAVPIAMQRMMASSIPFSRVFSLHADHSPFFSAPDDLVSILHSIVDDRPMITEFRM
jgi:pimeloyl-ACP methyl ester carboxylesterase